MFLQEQTTMHSELSRTIRASVLYYKMKYLLILISSELS